MTLLPMVVLVNYSVGGYSLVRTEGRGLGHDRRVVVMISAIPIAKLRVVGYLHSQF